MYVVIFSPYIHPNYEHGSYRSKSTLHVLVYWKSKCLVGFVVSFVLCVSFITSTKGWGLQVPPLVSVLHEPPLKGHHVARAGAGGGKPFNAAW